MKKLMPTLSCVVFAVCAQAATLHLAGSSQLSDSGYPYYSWGTELGKYMPSCHRVRNMAVSGASTKSYRASGVDSLTLDGSRDVVVEKCVLDRVDPDCLRRQAQEALVRDLKTPAGADIVRRSMPTMVLETPGFATLTRAVRK